MRWPRLMIRRRDPDDTAQDVQDAQDARSEAETALERTIAEMETIRRRVRHQHAHTLAAEVAAAIRRRA